MRGHVRGRARLWTSLRTYFSYCAPNTLQAWDDENVTQTVISEYSDFKFLVAGRIKAGLIQNFDDMANYSLKTDEFAKLSILVDICATFQASSVECELYSAQWIALKLRPETWLMGMDQLDQVMGIKSYLSSGKEAKLDAALGVS